MKKPHQKPETAAPVLTIDQMHAFLDEVFPQLGGKDNRAFIVEDISPMAARVRMAYHNRQLRPGGTISGPAMFTLADLSIYIAILGQIGPVGHCVTTSLNINFLAKPEPRDLIAYCHVLKIGKRLAIAEVSLFSEGSEDLVAHATGTYSIPSH